jgi:pyruvate dehydrogenase E1 component alpha subunit
MHSVLLPWMGDERGNAISEKLSMNPMCVSIGAQTLHAVGIAWAFKLRQEKRAVVVYFGDGATSTGDFHEAMNFASVMKVGCVFMCVNNGWAISVPTGKQTNSETFAQKAIAYGIPSIRVDGNDVFAVFKATRDAIQRARDGEGPTLIEALTYRLGDHTTADDARRYRCEEEFEAACTRDPIARTKAYLESKGLWDDEKQTALNERAKTIIHEAIDAALSIEKPDTEGMFRHTFAELPQQIEKQMQTMRTDSIGQDPEQVGLQSIEPRKEEMSR